MFVLLSDPWWTDPGWWLAIVLGIAGSVAVGVLVYLKQRARKQITYQILSDAAIISIDKRVEDKVKIFYLDNGKSDEINDANLVSLRVWNSGESDVKIWNTEDQDVQDMEQPIRFKFEGRTVVSLTELKTEPPEEVIESKDLESYLLKPTPEPDAVGLPRCFLKPKQSISLSILLQGPKDRIVAKGKLFQGNIFNFDVIRHKKNQRRRILLSSFVVLTVLLLSALGITNLIYLNNSQAITPAQSAQALVKTYYHDINNRDYQAAFNLWKSNTSNYCSLANGFAYTEHIKDTYIGTIATNPNGTFNVPLLLQSTETLPSATVISTYQGYQTVGQENGAWKIMGGRIALIQRTPSPSSSPTTSPNITPIKQAQTLIKQFHDDISNRDYPAAYSILGQDLRQATSYCTFINDHANTLSDEVLFGKITVLPDGDIQVAATINTTEKTSSGTMTRSYQATYLVGQENHLWKIISSRTN